MTSGRLVLIGGGVRSGKSRFALNTAMRFPGPRLFIATAEARDDEMRERVQRHSKERGEEFFTVEEPLDVPEVLARSETAVAVVDCLTLWLSNLLLSDRGETEILAEVDRLVVEARRRSGVTLLVANEVGMGIVPESPLARVFRDVAGRVHQRVAAAADEVYLGAMGLILRVKPSPLLTEDLQ